MAKVRVRLTEAPYDNGTYEVIESERIQGQPFHIVSYKDQIVYILAKFTEIVSISDVKMERKGYYGNSQR